MGVVVSISTNAKRETFVMPAMKYAPTFGAASVVLASIVLMNMKSTLTGTIAAAGPPDTASRTT